MCVSWTETHFRRTDVTVKIENRIPEWILSTIIRNNQPQR